MPYSLRAKLDGFVGACGGGRRERNVKKGDLLLTLDGRDIRAQLDQARAQLAFRRTISARRDPEAARIRRQN